MLQAVSKPWIRWVGLRYLKSKKNSRFLSFITFLSVAGVALGVAAIIVVLSVMVGFEGEFKKRLMSTNLHVLIEPKKELVSSTRGFIQDDFLESQSTVKSTLKSRAIRSVTPVLAAEAILRSGQKVSGVVVKGIHSEALEKIRDKRIEKVDPTLLDEKKNQISKLLIGKELAYYMGLIPGDVVSVVSPLETTGPMSSVPLMKKFLIEGIYETGSPDQELKTVYTKKRSVESFLRRRGVLTHWEVSLKDFEEGPALARKLRNASETLRVQDWREMNSSLFQSLELERVAMFIALVFIIIVASFNIVTTLTLMVLEKKKEISILKAMGATNKDVAGVFFSEGMFIGILGLSLGLTLGLVICLAIGRWEFIELPEVYYDKTLPVAFIPSIYLLIAVAALLIVLIACIYPSSRAAKLNPIEGIRLS